MLAAIIVCVAVLLDQLTKALTVANIELYKDVPFIPGLICFTHTENEGAAWSMFAENQWVYMIFSVLAIGAMVYLLIKLYRRHILLTIALSCVLGGGIGNMLDRVINGIGGRIYVVDFIKTEFMDFPVFNFADIFVCCGSALIIVYFIFFESKVEKRLKNEQPPKTENE